MLFQRSREVRFSAGQLSSSPGSRDRTYSGVPGGRPPPGVGDPSQADSRSQDEPQSNQRANEQAIRNVHSYLACFPHIPRTLKATLTKASDSSNYESNSQGDVPDRDRHSVKVRPTEVPRNIHGHIVLCEDGTCRTAD
jgi:hypothetical protein